MSPPQTKVALPANERKDARFRASWAIRVAFLMGVTLWIKTKAHFGKFLRFYPCQFPAVPGLYPTGTDVLLQSVSWSVGRSQGIAGRAYLRSEPVSSVVSSFGLGFLTPARVSLPQTMGTQRDGTTRYFQLLLIQSAIRGPLG